MVGLAEQLSNRYPDETLKVLAHRRGTGLLKVAEGLAAADFWTDVFEPVRERRLFRRTWTEIQPLQEAAANIEAFFRERPDQSPL
jgi:hypothetical protein